jgi:hypothetical protein
MRPPYAAPLRAPATDAARRRQATGDKRWAPPAPAPASVGAGSAGVVLSLDGAGRSPGPLPTPERSPAFSSRPTTPGLRAAHLGHLDPPRDPDAHSVSALSSLPGAPPAPAPPPRAPACARRRARRRAWQGRGR